MSLDSNANNADSAVDAVVCFCHQRMIYFAGLIPVIQEISIHPLIAHAINDDSSSCHCCGAGCHCGSTGCSGYCHFSGSTGCSVPAIVVVPPIELVLVFAEVVVVVPLGCSGMQKGADAAAAKMLIILVSEPSSSLKLLPPPWLVVLTSQSGTPSHQRKRSGHGLTLTDVAM